MCIQNTRFVVLCQPLGQVSPSFGQPMRPCDKDSNNLLRHFAKSESPDHKTKMEARRFARSDNIFTEI